MITKIDNKKIEIITDGSWFEVYVDGKISDSDTVLSFNDFVRLMNLITIDQKILVKIWNHHLDTELVNKVIC